jgi:hypothetical protein
MSALNALACVVAGCVVLMSGCGGNQPPQTANAADQKTAAPKSPAAPFVPVDACSLLTRADVEALANKPAEDPRKETLANLVTCTYGDPKAPKAGTRRLSNVASVAVFTGQEGAYYAGPAAQAKDAYETARKNAASNEAVSGLGESAWWDKTFRTLSVYTKKYFVSVTVDDDAGLEGAKKLMGKALSRLP